MSIGNQLSRITPQMLLTAVKTRLETVFPGEKVYENLVPRKFERPSNMVELAGMKLDTLGQGQGTVGMQFLVKIITYCQVDEVHDSHLPTLDGRCMTLLSAFSDGFLPVGDRAPKVTACTAVTEDLYDYAEVYLTLTLTMDRGTFLPQTSAPVAEIAELHITEKGV